MTNEEAIEELKGCIIAEEHGKDGKPNGNLTCELTRDTLEMVIKVLEQIPELKEAYNKGYDDGREAIAFHYKLCKEEGSIITIPDGATNGNMIMAMFGEPAKISEKSGVLYKFMYRNGRPMFSTFYDYDWWNSPYKENDK